MGPGALKNGCVLGTFLIPICDPFWDPFVIPFLAPILESTVHFWQGQPGQMPESITPIMIIIIIPRIIIIVPTTAIMITPTIIIITIILLIMI